MSKNYQHLSRDERAAIAIGLEQALSRRAIARRLNRSPSTISREVRRNGGKRVYHPARARQRREARRFRQERRLIADPGLWRRVLCWMRKGWSPEQCAGKLKVMYANDPKKRVSHETIYAHISMPIRAVARARNSSSFCASRARPAAPAQLLQ